MRSAIEQLPSAEEARDLSQNHNDPFTVALRKIREATELGQYRVQVRTETSRPDFKTLLETIGYKVTELKGDAYFIQDVSWGAK